MEKSFRNHPISNCRINFLLVLMYAREYWIKKKFFLLCEARKFKMTANRSKHNWSLSGFPLRSVTRGKKNSAVKHLTELNFFVCYAAELGNIKFIDWKSFFNGKIERKVFFVVIIVSMWRMVLRNRWICGELMFLTQIKFLRALHRVEGTPKKVEDNCLVTRFERQNGVFE